MIKLCLPFREDWKRTQGFGENPGSYAKFGLIGHNGLDYGLPTGTTVIACDDGTVVRIAYDQYGYGNYIKIQHSWGESVYAHLQNTIVPNNFPVKKGQAIGLSDNTGNSTGPHLHFGIRIYPYNADNGYAGYSDPTPYLDGHNTSEPPVQGGTEPVNIRDKFKIIFSVLHSKPEELVTEADVDQAVGSALDPYNYGTQDLNNRVIAQTIEPYLTQITTLTNRVKELENEIQNPPTPPPVPEPPQPPNPTPPVPPEPFDPSSDPIAEWVGSVVKWIKQHLKRTH